MALLYIYYYGLWRDSLCEEEVEGEVLLLRLLFSTVAFDPSVEFVSLCWLNEVDFTFSFALANWWDTDLSWHCDKHETEGAQIREPVSGGILNPCLCKFNTFGFNELLLIFNFGYGTEWGIFVRVFYLNSQFQFG